MKDYSLKFQKSTHLYKVTVQATTLSAAIRLAQSALGVTEGYSLVSAMRVTK